jgi:aspartate kinase
VIPLLNVPDWRGAKQTLLAALPSLSLVEDVVLVSVVGDGLAATTEPLARFLSTLRGASASPIALHASALRLGAVIPQAAMAEAQRALHRAFVEA